MKLRLPWRGGGAGREGWDDKAADEPVVSLLNDFAEGPMAPDRETLDRMGTRLRAAFAQQAAERRIGAAPGVTMKPARRPRLRLAVVTASLAVVAVAGTAAAATESDAGEPFYRVRLSVEALFLPPAGTEARLAADLDRADARLAEARAAAAAGNWNAESDALGAYGEVVRSMTVLAGTTAGDAARVRLQEQLAVLEQLRSGAGDGAAAQAGRAIDDVDAVLAGGPGQGGQTAAPTGNGPQPTPPGTGQQGPNASAGSGGGSGSGSGGDGSGSGAGSGSGSGTGTSGTAVPDGSGASSSASPGPQGTGQGGMPTGMPGGTGGK